MAKQDFQPILSPGIHKLSMAEFENIAVLAFPGDVRRAQLFYQFSDWMNQIKALGITGTIWVDGSFITCKPDPSDIDCFFFNALMTRPLNSMESSHLTKLLDHNDARALFNLDLYFEDPAPAELLHRQAYWSGLFGFQHDRAKAKGFAELQI